jgi:hypothetical protein
MSRFLILDIRKADELHQKRLVSTNDYDVLNIPMEVIRFNVKYLLELLSNYEIMYIVCQTGNRSKFIKDKYFGNYTNVLVSPNLSSSVLNYGKNNIILEDRTRTILLEGKPGFNLYNMTRVVQLILGTTILLCSGFIYYKLKAEKCKISLVLFLVLWIFALNALYSSLFNYCGLSKLLMDYMN